MPSGPIPPGNVGGSFDSPVQPQGTPQAVSGSVADYLCTAGIDLHVTFSADGQSATVAEMGYGTITLAKVRGGSSMHFASEGHVLQGQLQNTTWTRPGLRDVFCAKR